MAGRIAAPGAELTLINPADPDAVPLAVNPLAPEPGYPVQAHIDMVRALFLAAFDAHEPFPQIMSQALQRVYESCGWDPVTGVRAGRSRRAARGADAGSAPGGRHRGDHRGRLRAGAAGRRARVRGRAAAVAADRLGRPVLRRRSSGRHRANCCSRNAVLAIEDVANDEDKAFLIGTLIIRIVEHLRLAGREGSARPARPSTCGT